MRMCETILESFVVCHKSSWRTKRLVSKLMWNFTSSSLRSFAFLWNILNSLRISSVWDNLLCWSLAISSRPFLELSHRSKTCVTSHKCFKNFQTTRMSMSLFPWVCYSNWLRPGRSGDRIPEGERFFAPVQTSPGAHPASCTMGTGSFPGVKRPGRGVDYPLHLAPRLKKK